jgi:hypothetical protein
LKPLKLPNEDKAFNSIADKLAQAEQKAHITTEEENPDREKARKCEELRQARIKKLMEVTGRDYFEALPYADDGITQFELDWDLEKKLQVPPEVRYQRKKQRWHIHETSWCQRKVSMSDESCCNYYRCVPSCRFFEATGRVEDDEVIKEHNGYWERSKRYYDKERRIINLPREERRKLNRIISERREDYSRETQHGGWTFEKYEAIKTAVYNDYFNSRNNK